MNETLALRRIRGAAKNNSTSLDLSGLMFSEIPRKVGELSSLVGIDVGGNALHELLDWFSELCLLEGVNLYSNKFHRVPRMIPSQDGLQRLDLTNNNMGEPCVPAPSIEPEWIDLTCRPPQISPQSDPVADCRKISGPK
jgi:Leucine-rich repeat (LRR) protein